MRCTVVPHFVTLLTHFCYREIKCARATKSVLTKLPYVLQFNKAESPGPKAMNTCICSAYPPRKQPRTTTEPPAKRDLNGVLQAGREWPAYLVNSYKRMRSFRTRAPEEKLTRL